MSKELMEGLKSLVRTIVLAIVSYLLTAGVLQELLSVAFHNRLSPTEITLITGFLTSILTGVDKFLFKSDTGLFVEEKGKTVTKAGLLPF